MLLFSTGLPGRFSQWCDEVVLRLAESFGEPTTLERWPSIPAMLAFEPLSPVLDELTRLAIRSDAAHLVLGIRHPDVGLFGALAETRTRVLVAFDYPRLAVADLIEDLGAEAALATRAVANSCALLLRYASLPGALVLHGENARRDLNETALTIAQHLGFEVSAETLSQIAGDAGAAGGGDWRQRIPTPDAKLVGGALAGYEEHFRGVGLGRLVWNRGLFLIADLQKRASEILDITGGPGLIQGPYIHLPPGSWNARIHLGLSADAAQSRLLIEAWCDVLLASATLQPNAAGFHVVELNFSLGEASARGVEIRVTVPDPEAKGRFAFGYVVLTPGGLHHPEAATEWEQEFNAVLQA